MIADVTRGISEWWAPALAFAAGVVSFASPCVLPLVPGYLAFVSGSATEPEEGSRRRQVLPIVLFILGFAIVFTAIGVAVGQAPGGTVDRALHSDTVLRIAGAFVLLFGVAMILNAFRLGNASLYAERRPLLSKVKPGPAGALPLGMAFALGWSPCIGPVLGTILAVAAAQGGAVRGGGLLLVYSLGLGLPFLLIGLGVKRLTRALDVVKRNYHWIAGVSGVIMVAIGFLLVSGLFQRYVTPWLNRLSNVNPPL